MLDKLSAFALYNLHAAKESLLKARDIPADTFLAIAISTLFSYVLIRVLMAAFERLFQSKNTRTVSMKIGSRADDDTVYMNATTRGTIFGNARPDDIVIKGQGKTITSKLATRYANKLADNHVEVSPAMFHRLFPRDEIPEDAPEQKNIHIRAFASEGLAGFWFNSNRSIQVQSRLAVYLGIFLMFAQIGIELGLKAVEGT